MERYAIIDGGVVANLAVADDADFAAEQGWVAAGPEVAIGWAFDGEAFAPPVVPLDERKAALWEQVKLMRDSRITAGVPVPGVGTFDSDDASLDNINRAVTMAIVAASAGRPFSIGWKLADNSIVTLDGPGMIAAGVAVGTYVSTCHARAQALGIAIQAAVDGLALGAIDVGAGWP